MLSTLHPLVKLVLCLVWIVAAILVFDARFQMTALLGAALALMLLDRVSPLTVLALMVPFALFGFGFLTTSLLFREESGYATRMAGEAIVRSEAFSAGMVLFLRAVACGMVSALFALTTDPGQLIKAMMRDWRLPPRIGYALFSALQLVPDLLSEMHQARLARAMKRGAPPSRIPGPVETASLFVPMLAYAIRRAGRSAIAMEARGLAPGVRRTILEAPRLHRRDLIATAAALAILAFALAWTA